MEKYNLEKDLIVFYLTATSFPKGIAAAHEKLRALLVPNERRMFYGISRPNEKGVINYKVGVQEQFDGEGKKYGCQTMFLKNGNYLSIVIDNYTKHMEDIGEAFQNIIHQPGIDPTGYCVEQYESDNRVRCMVRMND